MNLQRLFAQEKMELVFSMVLAFYSCQADLSVGFRIDFD